MSELTRCNHCSLKAMRERAERRGATVILDRDAEGWITARYSDEAEPSAYFMELTNRCAC